MQASREIERDDFDRLIGWALAAETQNAHPSAKVWQRIVHRIVNSDETERVAIQDVAGRDRSVSYAGTERYKVFLYAGLAFTYGI